jgi:outer membrane protein assembly factor BamB
LKLISRSFIVVLCAGFSLLFIGIFQTIHEMNIGCIGFLSQSLPRILILLLAALADATAKAGENDWPRWRGPQDCGSTEAGNYPVKWNIEKVLWKANLPGKGCSTPIVWNHQIYVTAPIDGMDAALAYDWDGKALWQKKLGRENAGKHRNGSGSNPSPATDGKNVFVFFKSGNLAALDLAGEIRWQTNLVESFGPDNLYWDHGASPVLADDCVIMTRIHHNDSWLAAFDKASGRLRWKVARNYESPVEGDHSYGTPMVINFRGKQALLVWGAQHLTLHDVANGKLLWSTTIEFNPESRPNWPTVASVVVAGDIAILPFGRADRGLPRLFGIRLGENNPGESGKELWKRNDTGTFVPTPAIYKGRVYVVRDRGEVDCIDPNTGKTIWSDAFPKSSANFYSSPVVAAGKLYAAREDGTVFVAGIEGKFELLAENPMGEQIIASLTPCADHLLIRGEHHLFCIGGSN